MDTRRSRNPVCGVWASSARVRSARRAVVRITRKSIGAPRAGEGAAEKGIGPGGFEPPYPDPKSGVLPLDEGPATMKRLKLQSQGFRWKAQTCPLLARSAARPQRRARPRPDAVALEHLARLRAAQLHDVRLREPRGRRWTTSNFRISACAT